MKFLLLGRISIIFPMYFLLFNLAIIQTLAKNIFKQIGNINLTIFEKGANITLTNGINNIRFSINSIYELNSLENEIYNNNTNVFNQNHSIPKMQDIIYNMEDFTEQKCEYNLTCFKASFKRANILNKANINSDIFFFNQSGFIPSYLNNSKNFVKKGSVLLVLNIENWAFCTNLNEKICLDQNEQLHEYYFLKIATLTDQTKLNKNYSLGSNKFFFGDSFLQFSPNKPSIASFDNKEMFIKSTSIKNNNFIDIIHKNDTNIITVKIFLDLNIPNTEISETAGGKNEFKEMEFNDKYVKSYSLGGKTIVNSNFPNGKKTNITFCAQSLYEYDKTNNIIFNSSGDIKGILFADKNFPTDFTISQSEKTSDIKINQITGLLDLKSPNKLFSQDISVYEKSIISKNTSLPLIVQPGDYQLVFSLKDYLFCNENLTVKEESCGDKSGDMLEFEFLINAQSEEFSKEISQNKNIYITPELVLDGKNSVYTELYINNKLQEQVQGFTYYEICKSNSDCMIRVKINRFSYSAMMKFRISFQGQNYFNEFRDIYFSQNATARINAYGALLMFNKRNEFISVDDINNFNKNKEQQDNLGTISGYLASINERNHINEIVTPFHSLLNIQNRKFVMLSEPQRETLDSLNVTKISLASYKINKQANLYIDYLFYEQDGYINNTKNNNELEKFYVKKGDIRIKIKLENWDFCQKNVVHDKKIDNCQTSTNVFVEANNIAFRFTFDIKMEYIGIKCLDDVLGLFSITPNVTAIQYLHDNNIITETEIYEVSMPIVSKDIEFELLIENVPNKPNHPANHWIIILIFTIFVLILISAAFLCYRSSKRRRYSSKNFIESKSFTDYL